MGDLELPRRTQRLVLRAVQPGDEADLLAYRGRADVSRYLTTDPLTAGDVGEFVASRRTATRLDREGDRVFLAVELAGRVIGDVSLSTGRLVDRQGEIGWVFDPEHGGQGYATEAAGEVVRIAFDELGLHRVWAQLDPRNTASAALAARLGMRQEAHLREESWFKGEWGDLAIYALVSPREVRP